MYIYTKIDKKRKGIILAGGSGSRLYPTTLAICKQLLPIYDKPMIYYPLSTLMLAGIRNILIISTPEDTPRFERLLGDGSQLGLSFSYAAQPHPGGLAEALLFGASFIGTDPIALILGDNIFYGHSFPKLLENKISICSGGLIFGCLVKNPQRYGVIEFNDSMQVIGIEEKPHLPKSSYAVPGLYFYGPDVVEMTKQLTPSKRNELEITDLNRLYLNQGRLTVHLLGKGNTWLDTGTFDSVQKASLFVKTIQKHQKVKISCIEEIAYRKGYINKDQLLSLAKRYFKNEYGDYLFHLLDEK